MIQYLSTGYIGKTLTNLIRNIERLEDTINKIGDRLKFDT